MTTEISNVFFLFQLIVIVCNSLCLIHWITPFKLFALHDFNSLFTFFLHLALQHQQSNQFLRTSNQPCTKSSATSANSVVMKFNFWTAMEKSGRWYGQESNDASLPSTFHSLIVILFLFRTEQMTLLQFMGVVRAMISMV